MNNRLYFFRHFGSVQAETNDALFYTDQLKSKSTFENNIYSTVILVKSI